MVAYGHWMCKPTRLMTNLPTGGSLYRKLTPKLRSKAKARLLSSKLARWRPCSLTLGCASPSFSYPFLTNANSIKWVCLRQAKLGWKPVKKNFDGSVTGQPELRKSAQYTQGFCEAVYSALGSELASPNFLCIFVFGFCMFQTKLEFSEGGVFVDSAEAWASAYQMDLRKKLLSWWSAFLRRLFVAFTNA